MNQISTHPLDISVDDFRENLKRRKENRSTLKSWITEALDESIDYGKIHYVSKNKCQAKARGMECRDESHYTGHVLFKAGAEKICSILGVIASYPALEQYEQKSIEGAEIKTVVLRCHLKNNEGHIVSEGVGARALTQDYGDINKSLKMAKKSGFVDAAISLCGLSDMFTQDMEDHKDGAGTTDDSRSQPAIYEENLRALTASVNAAETMGQFKQAAAQIAAVASTIKPDDLAQLRALCARQKAALSESVNTETGEIVTETPPHPQDTTDQFISASQVKRLYTLAGEHGINKPDLKAGMNSQLGIESAKDILKDDYEDICGRLGDIAQAGKAAGNQ